MATSQTIIAGQSGSSLIPREALCSPKIENGCHTHRAPSVDFGFATRCSATISRFKPSSSEAIHPASVAHYSIYGIRTFSPVIPITTGATAAALIGAALGELTVNPEFLLSETTSLGALFAWGVWFLVEYHAKRMNDRMRTAAIANEHDRATLTAHFLCNALAALKLTDSSPSLNADSLAERFEAFLRYSIRNRDHTLVHLSEEISFARTYLELEKQNRGSQLDFRVACEEHTAKLKIPALLLQPILENALKHSECEQGSAVSISIRCTLCARWGQIEVLNSRCEAASQQEANVEGFGLGFVRRTLARSFGSSASFQLLLEPSVARAVIKIPLNPEN